MGVDYGTDQLLLDIADYVIGPSPVGARNEVSRDPANGAGYDVRSKEAVKTARYAIFDAMGPPLPTPPAAGLQP